MKHFANFGKINVKNLQGLQNLNVEAMHKDFITKSRVPKEHPQFRDSQMMLHDGLTHTKIKPSLLNRLPKVDNSKNPPKDYLYLNPEGDNKNAYNQKIESIGVGIEGIGRKSPNPLVHLGNSIRKRELSPVEKLATQFRVPEIMQIREKSSPANQEDVEKLIEVYRNSRPSYVNKDRGIRKVKGAKAPENSLEYKKAILEGRYIPDDN
jgi:hypothetical protein